MPLELAHNSNAFITIAFIEHIDSEISQRARRRNDQIFKTQEIKTDSRNFT